MNPNGHRVVPVCDRFVVQLGLRQIQVFIIIYTKVLDIGFFLLGYLDFQKLAVTRILYEKIKSKYQFLCYQFFDFLEFYQVFLLG